MNRSIIAATILALSAGMANAQSQPQAAPATPPRPTANAPTATPTPAAVAAVSLGKNSAASAAEARAAYTASISAKETACKARGATYIWSPAHSVGDPNPKGGFYARNSAGSCRQMTLKAATEKGLVTIRN